MTQSTARAYYEASLRVIVLVRAHEEWVRKNRREAEALDCAADEAAYYDQFDGGMAYERERHP